MPFFPSCRLRLCSNTISANPPHHQLSLFSASRGSLPRPGGAWASSCSPGRSSSTSSAWPWRETRLLEEVISVCLLLLPPAAQSWYWWNLQWERKINVFIIIRIIIRSLVFIIGWATNLILRVKYDVRSREIINKPEFIHSFCQYWKNNFINFIFLTWCWKSKHYRK